MHRRSEDDESTLNEREILYKVLFDMRQEMQDLKKLVFEMMKDDQMSETQAALANRIFSAPETAQKRLGVGSERMEENTAVSKSTDWSAPSWDSELNANSMEPVPLGANDAQEVEEVEEVLSLQDSEKELIRRALTKHRNRRKYAALELGISERTLYRKIKEYGLK